VADPLVVNRGEPAPEAGRIFPKMAETLCRGGYSQFLPSGDQRTQANKALISG
jgi:hypothetical protein